MNKIALYLFLIIGLFSCKGEDGRDGRDGTNGAGSNLFTKTITINKDQWLLDGEPNELNSYYFARVKVPELTSEVLNSGLKQVFIQPYEGLQLLMPNTIHRGISNNGEETLWSEHYKCEYEVGYITFIVSYSDFITETPPSAESFKLFLNW